MDQVRSNVVHTATLDGEKMIMVIMALNVSSNYSLVFAKSAIDMNDEDMHDSSLVTNDSRDSRTRILGASALGSNALIALQVCNCM